MADFFRQKDILDCVGTHLDLQSRINMAMTHRCGNERMSVASTNLRDILREYNDDVLTARYNDVLMRQDVDEYAWYRVNQPFLNIAQYANFLDWKYNHNKGVSDPGGLPNYMLNPCHIQPLHVALQRRAPEKVILNILRHNTHATRVCDVYGNFPLNIAVTHNATNGIVLEVLESFPYPVFYAVSVDKFPLNVLAAEGPRCGIEPSTSTVAARMLHFVKEIQAGNELPGHDIAIPADALLFSVQDALIFAIQVRNEEVVQQVIKAYPQCAALVDEDNLFPLHHALDIDPCTRIIMMLLKDHPPAAACVACTLLCPRTYAIFMAIQKNADQRVIESLLSLNPECTTWMLHSYDTLVWSDSLTRTACIPLHIAAEYAHKEAFCILLRVDRASIKKQGLVCNRTALHFAIDAIFDEDIDCSQERDQERKEIIMILIQEYEPATLCKNSAGHLPIDSLLRENIDINRIGRDIFADIILRLIRVFLATDAATPTAEKIPVRLELSKCESSTGEITLADVASLSESFKQMRMNVHGAGFYTDIHDDE